MPKSPRTNALFRDVVMSADDKRTIRISAYAKRDDQVSGVLIGLGYGNPNAFSKINAEITPAIWLKLTAAVEAAFAAADADAAATLAHTKPAQPPTQPRAKPPRTSPTAHTTDPVTPPTQPGRPARRRVG